MRKLFLFSVILFLLCFGNSAFSQFYADQNVTIEERTEGDLYVAGESVIVNGIVEGDFLAGGNRIKIMNRIEEDLMVSGGTIDIFGSIGDDVRVAGGKIRIMNEIEDDLVVFGGEIEITREGLIKGDVVVFGGEIVIDGKVEGNVKAYGGELDISGTIVGDLDSRAENISISGQINGKSIIAADDLELNSGASFNDDVTYWSRNEDYDIEDYINKGDAFFDDDLAMEIDSRKWEGFGGGSIFWWIIQLIMVAIVAMIFNTLFPNAFRKAPLTIKSQTGRSFGYGAIYLLLTPLMAIFLIVIVIGIPVGLSMLLLYGLSLLFATAMVALVTAYYLDDYYDKNWTPAALIGITVLCFIVIKLIGSIPYVGWIFKTMLVALVFGAFFVRTIDRRRQDKVAHSAS